MIEQGLPVALHVLGEQAAGHAGHQHSRGQTQGADRAAARAEAERRAEGEIVDSGEIWGLARNLLQELEIRSDIGIAAEPLIDELRRRRIAIGPERDLVGDQGEPTDCRSSNFRRSSKASRWI